MFLGLYISPRVIDTTVWAIVCVKYFPATNYFLKNLTSNIAISDIEITDFVV